MNSSFTPKRTKKHIATFSIICSLIFLIYQTIFAADQISTNSLEKAGLTASEIRMETLRKAVDDAEAAYIKSKNDKNGDELWTRFREINDTNLPQIFDLAKQEPKSETAFEMFQWILADRRIFIRTLSTNALQSIELLRDYHAANTNLAVTCRKLGGNFWDPLFQPLTDFLQKVAEQNPNREVRGQATLALARIMKQQVEIIEDCESDTNSRSAWLKQDKSFVLDAEKNGGSKTISLKAKFFCHIVLDKYADCPMLQSTNTLNVKNTLGELVETELFELEHLTVGKTAPELEGEGIDGKKLKLSDYRGKVVMLSFWASWCGPCMQMVPSEVRLAKRMEGKPFALVGINGDSNRDDAKHAITKKKMTWPSFWDEKGSDGFISNTWNIHGWPTVFLLDADGVIQLRFEGYGFNTEDLLNQKVDFLINQLEKQKHS
jgi:thiol-disulfide isomerase/thioredoxin